MFALVSQCIRVTSYKPNVTYKRLAISFLPIEIVALSRIWVCRVLTLAALTGVRVSSRVFGATSREMRTAFVASEQLNSHAMGQLLIAVFIYEMEIKCNSRIAVNRINVHMLCIRIYQEYGRKCVTCVDFNGWWFPWTKVDKADAWLEWHLFVGQSAVRWKKCDETW